MTEDRWRRVVGPAMVALALLGGAAGSGAVAIATAGAWWDPPPCDGGPAALVAAARGGPADGAAPTPWTELAPVLDGAGTLASQRLTIGIGPDEHRLDLPPESFAGGPFGHIVIVGADDGQRSRIRAIDVVAGCAWDVADEAAVVRRATISPDGTTLLEMRVDRTTRADLGIWQRSIDRLLPARRILPPIVGGRAVRPHLVDRVRLVGGRRSRRGPVLRRGRVPDADPRHGQRRGGPRRRAGPRTDRRAHARPPGRLPRVSRTALPARLDRSRAPPAVRGQRRGRPGHARSAAGRRSASSTSGATGSGGRHVRSTDADGGDPLDLGIHAAVPDPPGAPAPPAAPDVPATSDSEVTR